MQLAVREIRLYGVENFQIARRLRAMIDNLMQVLPQRRRPALAQELMLLDRAIETCYAFPEDRVLARTPDPQGLGGPRGFALDCRAQGALHPDQFVLAKP